MFKYLFIISVIYYKDSFGSALGRSILSRIIFPSATQDSFQWFTDRGTFRFGMQGKDQWRIERRYPDGRVFVRFAYRTPEGEVVDNSFTRGKLSEFDRKESGIQGTGEYEEYSPYDLLPQENVKLYGQEETAKPYGALSDAFQGETNMNSKEVVLDEKSKAIIAFLN
ncbi:UNVERIFIED_CONTAM: hypothetical protein RMT77_002463 [Armadillidium vulgare]